MDRRKARAYLDRIGLVTDRNGLFVDRMLASMEIQMGMEAYRNCNRFTGKSVDGIVDRIAERTGCARNMVNRLLFSALERFKDAYDPDKEIFSDICTERTLDVISPLQFLYLISCDFEDKFGK